MLREPEAWRPGSFTKNFSWGPLDKGLSRLREAIKICFDEKLENVPRDLAQQRLERAGYVWHIPLNFFLLNKIEGGNGFIVVDELVYQALSFDHSSDFDKLALVAFTNSYVGSWRGAEEWQDCPAPWAYHYLLDNIINTGGWDTRDISANSIQNYIESHPKYIAKSAKKLSTNLNYMYMAGGLSQMDSPAIYRWWVNSAFLVLDRAIAERGEYGDDIPVGRLLQYLAKSGFLDISGKRSRNKELALQPIASLYSACGGFRRWSAEAVRERQKVKLPNITWFANSDDPFFAIYPEDPNIIKSIPRACAMLAKEVAGFEELDPDELIEWNVLEYVRRKTRAALAALRGQGVKPTMSADELLKLTRGE